MGRNYVLQHWVLEALSRLGGSASPAEVAREIWSNHEDELRAEGDLFFTWQYDIRRAAQRLRDAGKLKSVEGDTMSLWQLTDKRMGGFPKPGDEQADLGLYRTKGEHPGSPSVGPAEQGLGPSIDEIESEERTLLALFPNLRQSLVLTDVITDTRMRNALARDGYREVGDISPMRPRDLMQIRGVGELSVSRLLKDLADRAPESPTEPMDEQAERKSAPDSLTWTEEASKDLSAVARWKAYLGQPNTSLLREWDAESEPRFVKDARSRLSQISAALVLGDAQESSAQALNTIVCSLDERVGLILRERTFADAPATLELLGEMLGLTRERVRQLEAKAVRAFRERLEKSPVGGLADALRFRIKGVCTVDSLLQEMPGLRSVVPSLSQPVWRVLDRLDDHYEIVGGWCANPSLREAISETRDALNQLRQALPTIEEATAALPHLNVPDERFEGWLAECGFSTISGHVLVGGDGIRERAHAILRLEGHPLSAAVIHERLGVERSLTAVKNALSANSPEIFTRVDRGEVYALSEWGMSEYSSIREAIRRELEGASGQLTLSDLVDRVTTRYSVAAGSVISYASAFPYEVKNGVVGLASKRQLSSRSPWRTRRLYRVGEAWKLRTEITQDHVRGAGSALPSALAAAIGLKSGELIELSSRLGPQAVTARGLQPSVGSIRRFVEEGGLQVGDAVIFSFSDQGVFDVKSVSNSGTSLADASLALIGAESEGDTQPLTVIARAVGVSLQDGLPGVIDAYRKRGDDDIAELLELM